VSVVVDNDKGMMELLVWMENLVNSGGFRSWSSDGSASLAASFTAVWSFDETPVHRNSLADQIGSVQRFQCLGSGFVRFKFHQTVSLEKKMIID